MRKTASKKNKRGARRTGFARTKVYPHERHPALYRTKAFDDIEYVTFTHSSEVDFKDGTPPLKAIRLRHNIDKKAPRNEFSHVLPRVYDGKRSALGKGVSGYRIHPDDYDLIDGIFRTSERYPVPKTGGGKKKRK